MPKKMGINSKAVEARERKADAKKSANDKAAKAAEDALWVDDDKQLAKKKKQKEDEERRKAEAARKKAEAKALLEEEMSSIKTTAKVSTQKVTRSQIEAEVEKRNRTIETINNPPKQPALPKPIPLEENLNRVMADTEVAQTIDQAIAVLSVGDSSVDRHPEKRMKAAYKAYEEAELTRLKQENPSLKLSQLKQMIFKNWQKSPENPMNQIRA
ncbi:coiled-coil domain-containing protein 124 [Anopheles ziemanni]|uniref:coiled-coil domain-containing protein 124 n=1 Tax=Anopheles coustani TaxID=139045 RepID=UPI00265B0A3E|nr:coiled-coil domain-containing protein 124 [Anopheles coustani]XP_058172450.1 coiled-coil domain-containing protein 124 [Anopheles ziemanni]